MNNLNRSHSVIVVLLILSHFDIFAQVVGVWKIVRDSPEVSGLSVDEVKIAEENIEGKTASVQDKMIKLNDVELRGFLSASFDMISIVDVISLPDSMSGYFRFFCQEITYFNAVTTQTIKSMNGSSRGKYLKVWRFQCDDRSVCAYVYYFGRSFIAVCVPGDGVYELVRK